MPLATNSALTIVNFDSAALQGSPIVAHRMERPGTFRLVLRTPGRRPVDRVLRVLEDGPSSASFDWNPGFSIPAGSSDVSDAVVRPGGYLRLRSTGGVGGLSAALYVLKGLEPVWDSRSLAQGDHFICLPLRPGLYVLANRLNGATSNVVVKYPDPREIQQGRVLATEAVTISADVAFHPSHVVLDAGQPLSMEVRVAAHLVLTLKSADDGPQDLAQWRARVDAELLEKVFRRREGNGGSGTGECVPRGGVSQVRAVSVGANLGALNNPQTSGVTQKASPNHSGWPGQRKT